MKKHCVSKTLFAFFFLCYSISGIGQDWIWVNQIGSIGEDGGSGVCDPDGNLYVAGAYEGPVCQFPSTTLNSAGIRNIFLAKFDQNGNELWAQQFNFENNGEEEGDGFGDIILDQVGNVYVTGRFYQELNFDGIILHAGSDGDLFLAKITPDGSCLWAKKAGGNGQDGGSAIAVDSLYNVYLWGNNSELAYFDSLVVERGGFLAKYNPNGVAEWVKKEVSIPTSSSSPDVQFSSMKVFKNKLFAYGDVARYTFTIDTISISHLGKVGEVLCCFDLSGNIEWLSEGLSVSAFIGKNLSTDAYGNIFITGSFFDTINFAGTLLINPLQDDVFICKYNTNGVLLWARQAKCSISGSGAATISNENGYCYLTGFISGRAIFETDTIYSMTDRDLFLARYTPDGNCLGVKNFGNAEGWSVGTDGDENPYLVGQLRDTAYIGDTTLIAYSSWWNDILAVKCGQITGYRSLESQAHDKLIIYANPTTGKCNITVPDELKNDDHLVLYIYDSSGRLIQQAQITRTSETYRLDIQAQAAGIYQAVLTNGSRSYSGKIVFTGN